MTIQGGDRGKYIGKLEIDGDSNGNWLAFSSTIDSQQKNRLRSLDYQINRLERQQKMNKLDSSREIAELRKAHQNLKRSLAEKTLEGNGSKGRKSKTFEFSLLPVKPKIWDKNNNLIVKDIKKSIETFNRFRRSALSDNDPGLHLALENDTIAGVSACAQCHEKQTRFWRSTRHAKAYNTLANQGQTFNLQCLSCHVTAGKVTASSDESKRLYLLSLSTDRQTIGCEVCHGPGNHHIQAPGENAPDRLPSKTLCLQCHTPERDYNFNYLKKLAKISCPN